MNEVRRALPGSALIVAVGLGAAVATGHGVASADTSDSTDSASSSSSEAKSSESSNGPDSASPNRGPTQTSRESTGSIDTDSDRDTGDSATRDDDEEPTGRDDDEEPTGRDDDEEPTGQDDDEEPAETPGTDLPTEVPGAEQPDPEQPAGEPMDEGETPKDPDTAAKDPASETPVDSDRDSGKEIDNEQAETPKVTRPADEDTDTDSAQSEERPADTTEQDATEDSTGEDTPAAIDTVPVERSDQETTASDAAEDVRTLTTPPSFIGALLRPINTFVSAVASLFAPYQPSTPADPFGSLLELIYVARSRIKTAFFNSTPTVDPVQIVQIGEEITGSLNPHDADFDELSYTVIDGPDHGTVVIHDDGTYTYTPDDPTSQEVDSFRVQVAEAGPYRFHGLRDVLTLGGLLNGLFGFEDAHTTTATVVVTTGAVGTGDIEVGERPHGVALNEDGTLAYVTNSGDDSVSVIDLETNTVVATIINVGNTPTAVVVGSGNVYVANAFGSTVTVIDTATNTITDTITVGDTPLGLALAAGGQLYVTNTQGDTVSVIDTATNTVTAIIEVGSAPQQVAVNSDGTTAYVTNFDDGTVSVIDVATNTVVATIAVGDTPQALAVSPDGTKVYVTGYDTGSVSVIDTDTNTVVDTVTVGGYPDAITISADGTRAYVTNEQDGTVSIIDTATNAVVGVIRAGDTGSAIAVSADGKHLYIPNFADGVLTVAAVNTTAQPPGNAPGDSSSAIQTFYVRNLTDKPVTFLGIADHFQVVYAPAGGTVIPPGGYVTVKLNSQGIPGGLASVYLQTGQPGDVDYAKFHAYFLNSQGTVSARCQGDGGRGSCSGIDSHNVALLAPSGSTIEVPSTDPDVQAAIVNALCRDESSCSFTATRQEETYTDMHPTGYTTTNSTGTPQLTKMRVDDTESQTTSISVSVTVGAKFAKIVNVEISATYGHSWTSTHTFSREFDLTVEPGQTVSVWTSTPVYRVYGDFTITYNGSTYILRDTYFDTPNPNQVPNYDLRTSAAQPVV